ncbi:MAG: FIST C-terminal domain-containing protein [Myxococcales bacterium]|nr:FIST C-terminal domain-containing protein [Myxococcales bacterium]
MLAFATAGYDQEELLRGVSEVTGGSPLAGCSAEGVITHEGSDEGSHAIGVMALASDRLTFDTFSSGDVSAEPRSCGERLSEQLRAAPAGGKLLLLFADGLTANCTELLAGLTERLPYPVAIVGGTAGDLLNFKRTYQYCDGRVASGSVSAVLIGGEARPDIEVSHGCDLIGLEQTITRAERGFVYEIEGRPAWAFFKEYLESDAEDLDALTVAHICLAELLPRANLDYGEHIIRVPLKLEKETGALFFAGGLKAGTRVHVAMRRPERICERAVASARRIAARHPGEDPLLVLQFDCAGRGRLLFGERTNEASIQPVQRVFGNGVPWLGLHTYGEIAPVEGRAYFHNYTLALCALYGAGGS